MIVHFLRVVMLLLRWPGYKLRGNSFSVTKVEIGHRTYLRKTIIGKYAYIGSDCVIGNAEIGNYTCIADNVQIGGMEHPYWDLSMSPKLTTQYVYGNKTIIGHDVWIAAGSIIKQGVTIGDGAVIGANSFVTKDVPPYAIVFGTPAQLYKYRFDKELIEKIKGSDYWLNPPQIARIILNDLKKKIDE